MLGKIGDPATVTELANSANVALVSLTATVPQDGARSGDKIDVTVMSLGASPSLRGGRLYVCPMLGPTGQLAADNLPFALAEGPVTIEDTVSEGDEIMVVVTEIDRQGRVNLSRKAAMQRHQAKAPA